MDINKLPFSKVRSTMNASRASNAMCGRMIFLSGQIGLKDGKLVEGGIKNETRQAIENAKSLLETEGLDLNDIMDVMVFLTSMDDYMAINEVYVEMFTKALKPTRTCIGVNSLPLSARVEIKITAFVDC